MKTLDDLTSDYISGEYTNKDAYPGEPGLMSDHTTAAIEAWNAKCDELDRRARDEAVECLIHTYGISRPLAEYLENHVYERNCIGLSYFAQLPGAVDFALKCVALSKVYDVRPAAPVTVIDPTSEVRDAGDPDVRREIERVIMDNYHKFGHKKDAVKAIWSFSHDFPEVMTKAGFSGALSLNESAALVVTVLRNNGVEATRTELLARGT